MTGLPHGLPPERRRSSGGGLAASGAAGGEATSGISELGMFKGDITCSCMAAAGAHRARLLLGLPRAACSGGAGCDSDAGCAGCGGGGGCSAETRPKASMSASSFNKAAASGSSSKAMSALKNAMSEPAGICLQSDAPTAMLQPPACSSNSAVRFLALSDGAATAPADVVAAGWRSPANGDSAVGAASQPSGDQKTSPSSSAAQGGVPNGGLSKSCELPKPCSADILPLGDLLLPSALPLRLGVSSDGSGGGRTRLLWPLPVPLQISSCTTASAAGGASAGAAAQPAVLCPPAVHSAGLSCGLPASLQ